MRQVSPRLVGALGALLVTVGAVVFAAAAGGPVGVVYDGVHPLLDEVDSAYESSMTLTLDDGLAVAWTTGQALGASSVVLGLLVLAALGGWLMRGRPDSSRPAVRG